jgi:hypothetical protein
MYTDVCNTSPPLPSVCVEGGLAVEDPECIQSHCILITHTLETLRQMALPYLSNLRKSTWQVSAHRHTRTTWPVLLKLSLSLKSRLSLTVYNAKAGKTKATWMTCGFICDHLWLSCCLWRTNYISHSAGTVRTRKETERLLICSGPEEEDRLLPVWDRRRGCGELWTEHSLHLGRYRSAGGGPLQRSSHMAETELCSW